MKELRGMCTVRENATGEEHIQSGDTSPKKCALLATVVDRNFADGGVTMEFETK